ncbi:hypothetical protein WG68_17880 [Arsukibacterium ikkense]|uniref:Uncharacterized protein n=2 Tax=Arsukibacterium ikkense TaxID=336831 RepID=A0A0M2V066_9GAMM|nr:hypothetical protein WG68_17880 [Arsukibacterium ikkense]
MRRLDHDTKFRNILMRWANSHTGQIGRIDTKLSYMLDHDKKQYRECPLAGCTTFSFPGFTAASEREEEQYESYESMGCEVSVVSNEFSVVKTGQQRVISNVKAEEYKVEWQVVMQDASAKKDTNLAQMVFWTTTPETEMQQAWSVQREFQQGYADNAEDNALVRLLGKEAYMALAAVTGDIENTDKEQYNSFLKELATIKGYPLSIKTEWYRDAQACQEKRRSKKQNAGVDLSSGLGGAARSMLSGMVEQQKERILDEWRKKPMFHYLYDITYLKEEMVHDSVFNPPVGYKLTDRQ